VIEIGVLGVEIVEEVLQGRRPTIHAPTVAPPIARAIKTLSGTLVV
jgi:hypothetical protein